MNTSPLPGGSVWTKLDAGGTPPLADMCPPPIAAVCAVGISLDAAREDHTHEGVHKISSADGTIAVVPASGLGDVDLASKANTATVQASNEVFVNTGLFPGINVGTVIVTSFGRPIIIVASCEQRVPFQGVQTYTYRLLRDGVEILATDRYEDLGHSLDSFSRTTTATPHWTDPVPPVGARTYRVEVIVSNPTAGQPGIRNRRVTGFSV